jgi:hypothetical protein
MLIAKKVSPSTTFSGHVAGLDSQTCERKEIPMDGTSLATQGQQKVHETCTSSDVAALCELVQFVRAWWAAVEPLIHSLDKVASQKAYDAFVEMAALARSIARNLGITLPDFSEFDWSASLPPAHHAKAFDL